MSNSEERMLILKMLQEGKINSEEAARLLEALDANTKAGTSENTTSRQQKQVNNFNEELNRLRDRMHEWKREFKNNYNQKDFERTVEEFATKAEKLGKNVANTTFGIVDKMIDFVGSYVDTNAFNIFGSYKEVERTFETYAAEGMDLSIEGVNSYITIKKHLDSKVIIKSKVRSPLNNADEILKFSDLGNTIELKLEKKGNVSVAHEIFLPAIKFNSIKLETVNGKIFVEDSLSNNFEAITKNSSIELMGVNSDRISLNTKNAKIQVTYVIGKEIDINTNNSVIDIKHIKASTLKAVTMNGRIFVENTQSHESSPDMNLFLKTTNGGIKVNMNDMESRGYKVKAQTTNGGVNLLIPEMIYHNVNRQGVGGSFVEAESNGYVNFSQKVHINAETINGYIEIVK